MKKHSNLRLMGVALALVALTAVAAGGPTSAGAKGLVVKTIRAKGNDFRNLRYVGADKIVEGQTLRIVNASKSAKLGPHTFSLVTKDARPSRDEWRKCGNLKPSTVCDDIATAHEVGPPPQFPVGKKNVENGLEGWDASFDNAEALGDSWFTKRKGQSTERVVTATDDKLFYFCVVHPFMHGKIAVEHPSR